MARSATPPSRARVDVGEWLGGIRLSGFMAIMLGLVVLAAFVLVPTFGTYIEQQQRISALEQAVEVSREDVAALEAESDRWKDPAYITTQARERLYYVMPGEVVYLVDDDIDSSVLPLEQQAVSENVTQTRTDWMSQLVRSVTSAGLADVTGAPLGTAPTP